MVETAFRWRMADGGFGIKPAAAARLQQIECADDVGLNKIGRAGDGTVHMGFGRQMQNMRDLMLLDYCQHGGFVAEVGFFKRVFGMPGDVLQIFQVAGVGQAIQVDEAPDFRFVNNVMDQVGSNEAGATCHKQVHGKIKSRQWFSDARSAKGRAGSPLPAATVLWRSFLWQSPAAGRRLHALPNAADVLQKAAPR
jgi:hypothetical protein